MKKKDIDVLMRVAERLEVLLPVGEYSLFVEYMEFCTEYTERYKKEAANRIKVATTWRKKNPEENKRRQKIYSNKYLNAKNEPDSAEMVAISSKALRQKVESEVGCRNSTFVLISAEKLKKLMAVRGYSVSEVATKAKVSRETIYLIFKGKTSQTSTADKIAKALEVEVIEILDKKSEKKL